MARFTGTHPLLRTRVDLLKNAPPRVIYCRIPDPCKLVRALLGGRRARRTVRLSPAAQADLGRGSARRIDSTDFRCVG